MSARLLEISDLPDSVTDAELLRELALWLYTSEKVSLGKAAKIAEMGVGEFMRLASGRGIPTCGYEPGELREEIEFLRDYLG
jgi:predicted HTH domain antitoxin